MRVRVEQDARVVRIALARPEKKNALDGETVRELREALRRVDGDDSAGVVVLTGDGPDFCAGADLQALEATLGAGAEAHAADAQALGDVFRALRALRVPVVAAVRGRALAGGAGLATACDIVLAHPDAQFGYPEVRIGFVPAMVMTLLRRSVGEKRAFDLVATGRLVSADDALRIGLVSRVLSAAHFDSEVTEIAGEIARSPAVALRLTKRLFYELDTLDMAHGIAAGVRANVEARGTAEFQASLRAFTRKRAAEGER